MRNKNDDGAMCTRRDGERQYVRCLMWRTRPFCGLGLGVGACSCPLTPHVASRRTSGLKVAVIDVNGANSYAKRGHIPGAVSFSNKDALSKQLSKVGKDTLVVAYCGSSRCSAYKRGASATEELGFKNVKHLSAGIAGWLKAGKKVGGWDEK